MKGVLRSGQGGVRVLEVPTGASEEGESGSRCPAAEKPVTGQGRGCLCPEELVLSGEQGRGNELQGACG